MKTNPPSRISPIPILARSNLYVMANGDGDDARFARIFRDTWRRLPLASRKLLLEYWRTKGRHYFKKGPIPRIQLLDDWPHGARDTDLLGQFQDYGHALFFRASMVDRMPEDVVAGLVAHELAHVVLLAQGNRSRGGRCEYLTDKLAWSWGFAPEEIDVWYQQRVRCWTKRGIQWHEPPLPREQVVRKVRMFILGNYNGRYINSRGIPLLVDDAA